VGEGLPLVVQESMSSGTPVVVGEDTAEAIDAPDGLVFSCRVGGERSVQVWEAALRRLLSNREALATLRPRVADLARSRWSWAACAARYGTCLDDLASGGRET
jgi:glycosyltransferase involved in cell wall biosynthesis